MIGITLVGLGCTPSTVIDHVPKAVGALDAADINVGELSRRSVRLPRVVAIPEAEFGRLLSYGEYGPPLRVDAAQTLSYAASANAPDALGITGTLAPDSTVTPEDYVIVMENPTSTPQGFFQSTRYHFASIRISGTVAYAFLDVMLHFNTENESPPDCLTWRGCRPAPQSSQPLTWAHDSEGGAGLPSGVLFDAETDARPQSFAGNTVEFRAYSGVDIDSPAANRFACGGEVYVEECSALQGLPIRASAQAFDKVSNAAVVSEQDFERWLRMGQLKPNWTTFGREAAITAAKLNHPTAIGVTANRAEGSATVDLLIVARNPYVDQDRFESSVTFVVPGPFTLPPGLFGTLPHVAFAGPLPSGPWTFGVCGPVLTPGPGFKSSLLGGYAYNPLQALYGTNRFALGKTRTTVRFPTIYNGIREISKIACSIYEPPVPPPRPVCVNGFNPITGRPIEEECNGVDDNCNGLIDEPGFRDACAIPACDLCVPASCGATRCATLPDGCGQVLSCPCP